MGPGGADISNIFVVEKDTSSAAAQAGLLTHEGSRERPAQLECGITDGLQLRTGTGGGSDARDGWLSQDFRRRGRQSCTS